MDEVDYWKEKTYKNPVFLNSPDARQIRILCELIAPKARFEKYHIENTLVFFGSARSIDRKSAEANLEAIQNSLNGIDSPSEEQLLSLDKARTSLKLSKYYEASLSLSRMLTEWSMQIPEKKKRFYICSGGGPGMMEAANRGASEVNGESIGLNISLPFEQNPNPFQTPKLSFEFHYFFIRKFWLAYMAKGLVVFPGGFGTMDELFELLTLIQTRKIVKTIPIVLFGSEFWKDFLNFETLIKWGVINEKDLDLFRFFDDVTEAFEYLKDILTEVYLKK